MSKKAGMSLNPEDFIEGGGLLDDANVKFTEVAFEMFDYQGTVPGGTPSMKVVMTDDDGEESTQYYSMGSVNDWAPSTDGKKLVSVGSATAIRSTSNGALFLKSLVDSGFPVDKIDDDISIFEGLQAHVIQIPAPERKGVTKSKKQKEREERFGPPTILVVDEIITLPWDKKKPTGAPKAKKAAAKKKPDAKTDADTPDASGSDGLTKKANEVVLAIVLGSGEVKKNKLPTLVFDALRKDSDRNAIARMVFEDEFLVNGDWNYDEESGTLSME